MSPLILFILGLAAGAGVALVWHFSRAKGWDAEREIADARLSDAEAALARQREDFDKALGNMQLTFKGISSEVLKESREEFIKQAEPRIGEHVRPLREALARYEEAVREIERKRENAYGGITGVLDMLKQGQQTLTRETATLVSALRSPTARGRWGEVTLQRVVEVAGMSSYCDFDTQSSVNSADGRLRPDLVVRLPQGRSVVVDAKVPLAAYMEAMDAKDEQTRTAHFAAHAKAVRAHMSALGQKNYWQQFDPTPDFVVLFLPGESFFSAALEADRALIEDGMQSRVILATPTTLIVMLRSVAMSWQQERLTENSQRISEAGKELFERCAKFAEHLGGVGTGLERALSSFNKAVGSWESRVVPGAKRLKELGAARSPDADIPSIEPVQSIPRQLASGEVEPSSST
ncbi:MAG: DNA recombination protein RmuC [bacterium]